MKSALRALRETSSTLKQKACSRKHKSKSSQLHSRTRVMEYVLLEGRENGRRGQMNKSAEDGCGEAKNRRTGLQNC